MCCLYHTFSPQAQGPVWKRRRKDERVGGGGWHLPDTVGLMRRLRQHTQDLHTLRTNKVPALNRRNRHKVPPTNQEDICTWQSAGRWCPALSNEGTLGVINHTPQQVSCVANTNWTQCVLCGFLLLFSFWLVYFDRKGKNMKLDR